MKTFQATFKWYDTDTYCTNLCVAESEEEVREHYECKGCEVVSVKEAKDYEVESAKRKGMPIVKIVKNGVGLYE